ncbi:MAG: ribose-phosphate pyrophosphokinase [Chitinophagales bacterium]|nr:ribose-phosphate pyrophosphokinase [Chitinophagales bacterium]
MIFYNLHLDPDFQPFSDGEAIRFEAFTFSGGEPHLKIQPDLETSRPVRIAHRLNSFQDLGLLCLAADALGRMGFRHLEAFIPYFPAARQDRVMAPGEPLSVKVYADLINSLQLERVVIFDPHSEVAPALLRHCTALHNHDFIRQVITQIPQHQTPKNLPTLLVAPDGGALKKIYKLAEALGGREVVECSKHRDVKTGQLSGFRVNAEDLQGQPCLLVDDICDGGGTFIGLAQALRAKNAGPLYLAVSHGIFSKGFEELASHFEQIFTTNSIRKIEHHAVRQIDLKF